MGNEFKVLLSSICIANHKGRESEMVVVLLTSASGSRRMGAQEKQKEEVKESYTQKESAR